MRFDEYTDAPFYDAADRATFTRHPVEDLEPQPESEFEKLADSLSTLIVWLAEPRLRNVSGFKNAKHATIKYFSPSKANLRCVAFIYAVRGDLVGTLREAAQRCRCSPEALRKHVDSFRRVFGYRTAGQWKPESRARLAAAMRVKHWRRRNGAKVEPEKIP